MKNNKTIKHKGFTLIELVVTIAIMAILISIAIPRFSKARLSAIVATHNSNVQSIKSAAVLALINSSETDLTDSCKEFVEGGELPDIPNEISKALSVSNWSIKRDSMGNIIVSPGLVELVGNEIKAAK